MNDGTDEEGKLILALDVGGTKIAGSVLRFSSGHMPELIRLVQEPTQAQEGGLAVLQRIVEFSCELLGRIDREVMGIGIGAAGVIALDGSIESATSLMPGWSGMPLGPALRAATGKTVSVVGDVHAHALGEAHWGAGRDVSSMLLVAVGTGIGGAMVLGGHVLHGAHNVGGHIGHVCHRMLAASGVRAAGTGMWNRLPPDWASNVATTSSAVRTQGAIASPKWQGTVTMTRNPQFSWRDVHLGIPWGCRPTCLILR